LAYASEERVMGAETEATVRHYHQVSKDQGLQERVERLGRKVVANWPVRPIGYQYRFNVIESPEFNASACAGGYIFIHSRMLAALESDQELEAVLAHEIAHVEQRHAIKELLRAKRDRDAAALFSAILGGGVSAAVAASTKNESATIAKDAGELV
jgi:predicted Zn-dependent protease